MSAFAEYCVHKVKIHNNNFSREKIRSHKVKINMFSFHELRNIE